MKKYKVLFADLDGTLIKTLSGETFPKGIWDMQLKFEVLDKIKEIKPEYICIVSNQGGIELEMVSESHFVDKMRYIESSIEEYTGIMVYSEYCSSNKKESVMRKPNTGMLEKILRTINSGLCFTKGGLKTIEKEDCLMIGDASGKPGQFSNSDLKTAENFGIDYLDVADFVDILGKKDSEELFNFENNCITLIDKAVLVAKIKKRLLPVIRDKHYDEWENGQNSERIAILNIINTLEVKEVDLEKEYKDFVEEDPVYNKLVNGIVGKAIAKHFFELGLKQKKVE